MVGAPRGFTALRAVFALNGLGVAVWFPRIPDVKAALGLDLMTLALCLLGLPAGTLLGFLFVGRMTRRFGLKAVTTWAGAALLLSFIGPGFAWNAVSLGIALFACGLCVAAIEVAMNAKASQTEAALGRRIMTQCHAYWSFGAMGGALLGGAFAEAGIAFLVQQAILQPLLALGTILCARGLLDDAARKPVVARGGLVWPSTALLLVCLAPIGALLVEGAMMEWSAILLREHVGAAPLATAGTFAAFALAMALTRLAGDRLAETLGPQRVMRASGVLMGLGIAAFALSPSIWLSAPLAVLVGIGCANIYPLAMSIAAGLPGQPAERNVATLAMAAFTAFLIGPPFIGLAASLLSLPVALALLAPLGLAPFLMPRRARAATG